MIDWITIIICVVVILLCITIVIVKFVLKQPQGEPGKRGPVGPTSNFPGTEGPTGPIGPTGKKGPVGPKSNGIGYEGPTGPRGHKGATGDVGVMGPPGNNYLVTEIDLSNSDVYIDPASGSYYKLTATTQQRNGTLYLSTTHPEYFKESNTIVFDSYNAGKSKFTIRNRGSNSIRYVYQDGSDFVYTNFGGQGLRLMNGGIYPGTQNRILYFVKYSNQN